MLADACFLACEEYYNSVTNSWEPCGASQPTLFISTELDLQELQTMALAFITGINEDVLLNGNIDFSLKDRVQHGIEVLAKAPLKIELVPNFTIRTIESMIRRYHTKGVNYFAFDYLSTSLGIIEEISKRTRGMAMREDTVLYLFAVKLKELAVELDCFIFSSTQLNGENE